LIWGQAPFCQTAQETALPVTTHIPLGKDGRENDEKGGRKEKGK